MTIARRPAALLLALVLVPPGLGGCGSGPAPIGRTPPLSPDARAHRAPLDHEAYAKLGYRVQWRGFPSMSGGAELEHLDVLGDIVVAQDAGTTLTVMEVSSGANRWSDQLGSPLTKFVGNVRTDNLVVASSDTEAFYLAADTGTLTHKHGLARVVATRPLVAAGFLVYGTRTGHVITHRLASGYAGWGTVLAGSIEVAPVAIGSGAAGVVSSRGGVLIFDPATGMGRGRARISGGPGAPLAASDSMLFVASVDQSLYAFDAADCSLAWRRRTEAALRERPVYHDGKLYCSIPGTGLTCFEAETGRETWSARDVRGHVIGLRAGRLVVWAPAAGSGAGGSAWTLDPSTGQVIERVSLEHVSHVFTDTFVDGNLYTGTPNGVVAKFTPR